MLACVQCSLVISLKKKYFLKYMKFYCICSHRTSLYRHNCGVNFGLNCFRRWGEQMYCMSTIVRIQSCFTYLTHVRTSYLWSHFLNVSHKHICMYIKHMTVFIKSGSDRLNSRSLKVVLRKAPSRSLCGVQHYFLHHLSVQAWPAPSYCT